MRTFSLKQLIAAVCAEGLAVAAIYAGILPRESVFVIEALLLMIIFFYAPSDAAALFIASIPFFLALPLGAHADNFASWRPLLIALLFAWFIKERIYASNWPVLFRTLSSRIAPYEWCALGVFALATLSLFVADNPAWGLRKIIFLGNIIPLYIVVRSAAHKKPEQKKFILSVGLAGMGAAIVSAIQFIIVQFSSLYDFWQHWAQWVTPLFYGNALAKLLMQSNTWFSYYAETPPTLRLFSVFPDSHSFGLFNLFAASVALFAFGMAKTRVARIWLFLGWLSASFLIYLSGTRGLWISALPILSGVLAIGIMTSGRLRVLQRAMLLFALTYAAFVAFLYVTLNTVALSVAFGACNRSAFFCSRIVESAFIFPENAWLIGIALIFAAVAVGITYAVTIRVRIFDEFLPKMLLIPLLMFLLLLPISSVFVSRMHGAGIRDQGTALLLQRASSILDLEETSNKARMDIWRITAQAIAKHPLLGVGAGNYAKVLGEELDASRRGASAHNLYLDFAAETGIFGGALTAAFFVLLIYAAYRLFHDKNEHVIRIAGAIFGIYFLWLMLYNFFDIVLLNDKVLLLFAAVLGMFSSLFIAAKRERLPV